MAKDKTENPPQLNVNVDPSRTPILYTDMVFMNATEDGVTFEICQKVGVSNQLQVVARIGMSREHAKKFAQKLGEILALTTAHSQTGNKN